MKTKLLSALAIASIAFLFSCKGKDGAVGPAGPAGSSSSNQQDLPSVKEGYIKGTATGTTLTGTNYSYNLDLEGIWSPEDSKKTYYSDSHTSISIKKTYAGQGDINGEISISFDVTDMNTLSSVTNIVFAISATKDLGNNTFHQIDHYYYIGSSTGTAAVSNLVYNSSTGVLTGTYSVDFPADTNEGALNIADGTFSTKLSTIVNRMAGN